MPKATSGNSAEQQAYRLETIEEGRQAAAALAFVIGPVKEYQDLLILRLIQTYKGADISHDKLIGAVAELSALDSLIKELEKRQRQGDIAADKEFGNG